MPKAIKASPWKGTFNTAKLVALEELKLRYQLLRTAASGAIIVSADSSQMDDVAAGCRAALRHNRPQSIEWGQRARTPRTAQLTSRDVNRHSSRAGFVCDGTDLDTASMNPHFSTSREAQQQTQM
ncbi:hypothetical protein J6590_025357 [Homalodisca vitripennis]|nr:hypothetical protein J6590_025357 [Homalodisca vitripennis]